MGVIGARSNGVHIEGMFFFRESGDMVMELLNLLMKSAGGKRFARYASITPEAANLPEDVLAAIPYRGVRNSATGDGPKSVWEQIGGAIVNAVVSVVNFIYNGLVAVGNFIAQAAEVITKAAMAVFNTVVNAVKAAVEAVKKVFDAVVEWVKREISELYREFLEANRQILNEVVAPMINAWESYKESGRIRDDMLRRIWEDITKVVYVSMVVWGAITTLLYMVVGVTAGVGNFIIGGISVAIEMALGMWLQRGEKPGWLTEHIGKDYLINKIARDIGERYTDAGVSEDEVVNFFLSLFSMGLSFVGWALSAIEGDVSGTAAGVIGASVATAGIIFAGLINMLDGDAKEHMRWICYGFSVVGIFIGLIGLAKSLSVGNGPASMISFVGVTIGVGSFLYTLFKVK